MGSHLELRVMAPSLLVLLADLSGCSSSQPRPSTDPSQRPTSVAVAEVSESFLTRSQPEDNLDSLAVAPEHGWVIGTTKGTHQLVVFDADNGREVRRIGGEGDTHGSFRRPNGVAVVDDLVMVVERDNTRVQVLQLPDFEPVGVFGEEILQRPYGIAIHRMRDGFYDVYVTDQFEIDGADPSGDPRLAERVKQFRIAVDDGRLQSKLVRTIGETSGEGALWKVETIALDSDLNRLLVADEHERRMDVKVYTLDGVFSGVTFGSDIITSEPEGIALRPCGKNGVWVVTDQHDTVSLFHLFDRQTFDHLGVFAGEVTANTDGIAVNPLASVRFPGGAVYAVDDDSRMAAFDWRHVVEAVEKVPACASD
jgi:3-phytase